MKIWIHSHQSTLKRKLNSPIFVLQVCNNYAKFYELLKENVVDQCDRKETSSSEFVLADSNTVLLTSVRCKHSSQKNLKFTVIVLTLVKLEFTPTKIKVTVLLTLKRLKESIKKEGSQMYHVK